METFGAHDRWEYRKLKIAREFSSRNYKKQSGSGVPGAKSVQIQMYPEIFAPLWVAREVLQQKSGNSIDFFYWAPVKKFLLRIAILGRCLHVPTHALILQGRVWMPGDPFCFVFHTLALRASIKYKKRNINGDFWGSWSSRMKKTQGSQGVQLAEL